VAGPIAISILANDRGAQRVFASVGASAQGMSARVGKAGKALGVAVFAGTALAAAGAAKLGAASVSSASDAQQSLGATETVFGKYADTVIKRSNEAAQAIGLSANEYRELSNVVGASLAGAGVPIAKTAKLTDQLNKRAADMAATFGGTTREAVESISSLMRGEADPIERYGVSIKQSDVSARLAAKGLSGLTGEALKQAEMQARLDLLFKKTKSSQGAFAKESGTLAGQQQRLGAQVENLKARIGAVLLPILTKAAAFLNANLTPAFETVAAAASGLAPYVEIVGNTLEAALSRIRDMSGGASALTPVVEAFKTYATTAQTVVLPAVVAVASYLAARLVPVFTQVAQIITGRVIPIVTGLAGFLYGTLVPAVVAIAAKVATNLRPVFEALVGTLQSRILPALSTLLAKFEAARPTIQRVIVVVARVVGAVLTFAAAILGKVLPPLIRFTGFLTGTVVSVLVRVVGAVARVVGAVISFGGAVVDAVRKVGEFQRGVSERVAKVVGYFINLPGRITGAFAGAASMLLQTGVDIIAGLLQGIREKAGELASTIQSYVIDKIPGPVKKALGIKSPSRVMALIGKQIVDGLIVGVSGASDRLSNALGKVATLVDRTFDDRLTAVEKRLRKRLKGAQLDKALRAAERANNAARRAAVKGLADEEKALRANAVAQDRLAAKLETARNNLAAAKQAMRDYATSVRDSFISFGSITSLGQGTGFADPNGLVANLRAKVEQAKQYAAMIQQLIKAKLNPTTLQQLIEAGVEGGFGTAQTLLAGGGQVIQEVNVLQGQLATAGQTLGNVTAQHFHGAGVQAAQGIVAGLEAQAKNLDKAAIRLANKLVKAVKKALGIKSPSRVFRAIATDSVRGLGIGFDDTYVRRIGTRAATALQQGFGTPALDAYAKATSSTAGSTQVLELRLSAEQLTGLLMGRMIMAWIDAARAAGVKWAAV